MISKTTLTEQYTIDHFLDDNDHNKIPLFAVDKGNNLFFITNERKRFFESGTTIVSLVSSTLKIEKALERLGNE